MEYFTIENMLLYFVFSYMLLYICLELSQFILRAASGESTNNPDIIYPLLSLIFPLLSLAGILLAFILYYYIKTNTTIRSQIKYMVKGSNKYNTGIHNFLHNPYYRNLVLNDIQTDTYDSTNKPYYYEMMVKEK